MAEVQVVEGVSLEGTISRYPKGATITLARPANLCGFALPAKSQVYVDAKGALIEAKIAAALDLGAVSIRKSPMLGRDAGAWLAWGFLGKKVAQGGLNLAAGDPVRVNPEGAIVVAFPSKAVKLGGVSWPEGTRLLWDGSAWNAESDEKRFAGVSLDAGADDSDDEEDEE